MKRIAATAMLMMFAGVALTEAQDPAVVNPTSVKVRLDNARVRVLEALLQPGQNEKLHSHPAYTIYVLSGGKVRNHAADGATSESVMKTGDVIYRDALTHWAENIGNTPIHLILVELKDTAPSSGPKR